MNLQEFWKWLVIKIWLTNPKPCRYDHCKSKADILSNLGTETENAVLQYNYLP